MAADLVYLVAPELDERELNSLFAAAWLRYEESSYARVLKRSLSYICAYRGEQLVGFVNVAWDGGVHGFLLDTTVHPEFQRQGIGRELVRRAAGVAKEHGLTWLHVDYEAGLEPFYSSCGFRPTKAALLRLG